MLFRSIGSTTPIAIPVGSINNRILDKNQGVRNVASATTITLPEITDFVIITGTSTIDSIEPSWAQRVVTLRFDSVLTINDGGNLKLAGAFVTSNEDTLTLICDGANWFETSRSLN